MQTQAGKGVDCVSELPLFPTIPYNTFLDEVGAVMHIHWNYVSVGYKLSTSRKNDPVTTLDDAKALSKLFEYAVPLAHAAKSKPGAKPFKVILFEVMPKADKSAGEPIRAKGKQARVESIFILMIYIVD